MKTIRNVQTSTRTLRGMGALLLGGALAVTITCQTASADDLPDPLHGFCAVGCVDNGINSPTTTDPVNFGFNVSPGPATGDFRIEFLVANNLIQSAPTVTGTVAGTAALFSATAWTSGDLDTYLGISASPSNPIGAYLPSELSLDPGATGFFVYQLDLNTETLAKNPGTGGPSETANLLLGSYIVGFLNEGTASNPDWVATANSGAIFLTNAQTPPIPEPSTLLLLCTGLVGAAFSVKHRFVR